MFLKKNICKLSFMVMMILSLVMFLFGLYLCLDSMILFFEWEILELFSSSVMFSVLLDYKSVLFMLLVMFISSMVVLYTNE